MRVIFKVKYSKSVEATRIHIELPIKNAEKDIIISRIFEVRFFCVFFLSLLSHKFGSRMFVIVAQCQILINEYNITDCDSTCYLFHCSYRRTKLDIFRGLWYDRISKPFIHSRSQIYNEAPWNEYTEIYIYQDKKLFRSV